MPLHCFELYGVTGVVARAATEKALRDQKSGRSGVGSIHGCLCGNGGRVKLGGVGGIHGGNWIVDPV
ncbi:hypothetical protein Dimus_024983 [Dionaea muscipula]